MSDVVVKLVAKYNLDIDRINRESIAGVRFISDGQEAYDWLVVYDDLVPEPSGSLANTSIQPACDPKRTVLLTYEPSSIKFYGSDFVKQFAHVLTSHDAFCLNHFNRHPMPPVGVWYYGSSEDVNSLPKPPVKSEMVSIFYSGKAMQHSLHDLRHRFITGIIDRFGARLQVFGKGYHPVAKKKEALDAYRYHIAIENHQGDHHWTEKISDCYLGYCVPIYAGCLNIADYFPRNSYIRIDPRCVDDAYSVMSQAMEEGFYEKNFDAIQEARTRVLTRYSLGYLLSQYILSCEKDVSQKVNPFFGSEIIYSRRMMMYKNPLAMLRYGIGKWSSRRYHRLKWRDYCQSVG